MAVASFMARVGWRIYMLLKATGPARTVSAPKAGLGVWAWVAADIVFLRRLLRDNPRLWVGEWLFHASIFFVAVRHLRYLLDPAPWWVACVGPFGVFAGYMLAASTAYIVVVRLVAEKARYISRYNLALLAVAFVTGLTGILLRTVARTDLAHVKEFTIGILIFSPRAAPDSGLFIFHFVLALLFLVFLPSHVFAATFTMIDARLREESAGLVLRDDEK